MRAMPGKARLEHEEYSFRVLAERGAEMLGPANDPKPTLGGLRTVLHKLGGPAPPQRHLYVRCAFELERSSP